MHYCANCGSQLDEDVYDCPYCGYHNPQKRAVKNAVEAESEDHVRNGCAIAGFILSLLIPILGIIFSGVGLGIAKFYKHPYRALAGAGLTIGIAYTVIGIVAIIIYLIIG